ncbi:MAG: TolC family outer membrane protein [Methylophilaceae bacterium]|nr:TolC family outer membrane protein [Methylophilaceae bacterium]
MSFLKKIGLILLLIQTTLANAEDLLDIYQQALRADPELRTAQFKVNLGNAQKGQALGQLLPQVNASANWSANNQHLNKKDNNYAGTRYYISLNQSLIDFAKFWDWRRAQEVENQYASELTDAQHALMLNVIERYFSSLDAEDALYLTQLEIQATSSQLEQIKKLFTKQLVTIPDVYEVEARLDQLKADEIEAESNLTITKQALNELTNQFPLQLNKLRENIEYNDLEGKLEDWIQVAKSENPILAAKQSAIEAANNNVTVQKSKYLPVVDLQLNYYDTNTGYQNSLSSQYQTQVAAININIPIFTGGMTTYRMREAQSRLSMIQEEKEAKTRALIKEVSDAYTASNANARRIKASEIALRSAAKSLEAMQSGLKYGVESISDVLRAQQEEFKAKRALSKARYKYITNRIRFLKAIGTISEGNLHEVNSWLVKQK